MIYTPRENGLRVIRFYRDDLKTPEKDGRLARKFSEIHIPVNITMTAACTYQQFEHSTKLHRISGSEMCNEIMTK